MKNYNELNIEKVENGYLIYYHNGREMGGEISSPHVATTPRQVKKIVGEMVNTLLSPKEMEEKESELMKTISTELTLEREKKPELDKFQEEIEKKAEEIEEGKSESQKEESEEQQEPQKPELDEPERVEEANKKWD